MASKTVELRLRVRYEREDGDTPSEAECVALLENAVAHLTQNCLLTGETDLTVEDYRFDIEAVH